jgi:hypothetical protein
LFVLALIYTIFTRESRVEGWLVINFGGCGNRRELHIVQPKRALDQRVARSPHYLDRDQSRLRSRREISQQFPPPAGAQQVFGARQLTSKRNGVVGAGGSVRLGRLAKAKGFHLARRLELMLVNIRLNPQDHWVQRVPPQRSRQNRWRALSLCELGVLYWWLPVLSVTAHSR